MTLAGIYPRILKMLAMRHLWVRLEVVEETDGQVHGSSDVAVELLVGFC